MAVFVSVFVVLVETSMLKNRNLTSVQKSSEFDLRDVFTILSLKFVFSQEVERNC